MKRNLFFTILAGIILFAACNKEELGELPISEHTIYATLPSDDPQTRTAINDNLQVVWGENDQISVFAVNGDEFTNNQGVISGGVGTTDATFSVTVDGTEKVAAVYPYVSTTSFDGETITITMDNEYQYSENGICGAPMAAIINSQDAIIAFKNAGALMGLTVNNIPEGYNKAILESTGEEDITGVCEITFDANGNPTLTPGTEAEGGKTITINFEASASLTSKTFYFPIPVQEYEGLKLSISNGSETKVLKQKALNAKRSMRYKSTLTLDEVSGSTPVDASSASEATEKLSDGNSSVNVTITENETEPTISLPPSEKSTSLSFESIPEGRTVTIQETEGADVSDNVNISVSSDENSENSFDIQLPNSTVTLNANGEEATYDEVTASTAEETLIISQNVTVTTLKIKKGHVRVHGKIGSISREGNENGEVTYIIKEEGAEILESITDENIKVVSAAEWDLHKAVEVGGEYTLTSDIQLSLPIIVEKDLIVNLNNHSLIGGVYAEKDGTISEGTTDSYVFWVKDGTLTINGEGNVTASEAKYSMAVWADGGNVVINGGNYSNLSWGDLIYAKNGSVVTINGGTFTASNVGFGSEEGTKNEYCALNIKDNSGSSIIVKGGSFFKFDPANNYSEGEGTNYVAEGYTSRPETIDGATWYSVIKDNQN